MLDLVRKFEFVQCIIFQIMRPLLHLDVIEVEEVVIVAVVHKEKEIVS